jgi:2-polyprenyl-6-methoxyphenol hydroxylase-like FAD-dependent oxidoreductase
MKVAILGAGPAGLYAGYLLRKWLGSDVEVKVVEQNPQDATWGFGVVFSDEALQFLERDDKETHDYIIPHMERWKDLTINNQDTSITLDGVGFTAIGRLKLLLLLQKRATDVGVNLEFDRRVESLDEFADADLIIAADGVNSLVRTTHEKEFGTEFDFHPNKFLWYGTSKPYDTLTQTFRENEVGEFNVHHYRFSPSMSTFLVETNAATWEKGGFEHMDEAKTKAYFEDLFSQELDGHPIILNNSSWRNFPKMSQKAWSHKNMVLVGDALHTAHFSIGSGTRLAMEDVIQLVKSLKENNRDVNASLRDYEEKRLPIVKKIVDAANTSLDWYTDFGEHMKADPYDFVYSYLGRSGRISEERMRTIAPTFMSNYIQSEKR